MIPAPKEKAEARARIRQYEANMAVEDMHLDERDWAVLNECIERGMSREEAQARIVETLREDGIISADENDENLNAE